MKLQFWGAAQTVTGSKHLLELASGFKILLDCGLFQGSSRDMQLWNHEFGFDPASIDALVLSHAHIDHSGLIPKLVRDGFNGPIYCTPATHSLVEVMLRDSAKIQEDDIKFINKKRKAQHLPPIEPLYTMIDTERALKLLTTYHVDTPFTISDDCKCLFTEAGHILGSVSIHLTIKDRNTTKRLTFSGDIGRYNDPILKSPAPFAQADYIICESTYGDKLHDDLAISDQMLLDQIINTCQVKKGKLIIPAFSLGRTQEIVYALNRLDIAAKLPNVKVYVDSPLSSQVTSITKKHTECYNHQMLQYLKTDSTPFDFPNLIYITDVNDSKALNSLNEPCVILSASGMAEAGRIKHHIANNIQNPNNTILIVGYCEPSSLGAILQNEEINKVRIFGDYYDKKAEIKRIKGFSAHADYNDISQYLSCQDPHRVKTIFLVHGEPEVQSVFRAKLHKKGFDFVEIPSRGQIYHI